MTHTPPSLPYRALIGDEPIFRLRLMDRDGTFTVLDARDAKIRRLTETGAVFEGFPLDLQVTVTATEAENGSDWGISVQNGTDSLIEWVDFPLCPFPKLRENGGDGSLLIPYNEGLLVTDAARYGWIGSTVPEYPSQGWYPMFPYMMCSQFECYLSPAGSWYLGAHDEARSPKGIHMTHDADGVTLFFKHFSGGDFGGDYTMPYPVVLRSFRGDWHDGAEIYRRWFEAHLPHKAKKIRDNPALPAWYKKSPLVLSYCVRGVHDMDKMDPNALFPYENGLPYVDRIAERWNLRLMVLLMHWEGSAPWAPPYVWPPYGGEESFCRFADALHDRGHTLGVYCSGFGYSIQSNLVDSYNRQAEYDREGLRDAMCVSPGNTVERSRICTGQRSGYDLCLGADKAQTVLARAYGPLFRSPADYVQILDQNHGGSQYFCYARDHHHPPCPGAWMTDKMNTLLDSWNEAGGGKLFGCESAAAEAFLGQLLFSDNRFELNWSHGVPVPLYGYLYHEYLRNFMGNQVSCGLDTRTDTLRIRMAYSFAAGDAMTVVMRPDGELMTNWGNHDFSFAPDREKAFELASNLARFYREEATDALWCGRMLKPEPYECPSAHYDSGAGGCEIPHCLSTAWETDGGSIQIFVNHTDGDVSVTFRGETFTVPALSAVLR